MNNGNDYINIKEFAEIVKRSQQSIYKRLSKVDNPLKAYAIETLDGLKLHKDALRVVYGIEQTFEKGVVQPSLSTASTQKKEKETTEEKQTAEKKVIEILTKELEEQRKSNDTKEKRIEELTQMLKDSQRMLEQQQQLNAINSKIILDLQKPKRKGFFDLFRKKGIEQ